MGMVTGCDDGCVSVWDTRNSGEVLLSSRQHSHWVWSTRYNSYHDQLVLSSGSDSRVVGFGALGTTHIMISWFFQVEVTAESSCQALPASPVNPMEQCSKRTRKIKLRELSWRTELYLYGQITKIVFTQQSGARQILGLLPALVTMSTCHWTGAAICQV